MPGMVTIDAESRTEAERSGPRPALSPTPPPRNGCAVPDVGVGDWIGGYRVTGAIGRGGMADVYRAVPPHSTWPVAIKVARSDDPRSASFERLELEVAILGALRHPAVTRLLDAGVLPGGTPWFAMDLVDGETLTARLARGPLDLGYGCRILADLAGALRAALAVGVVHRDLKPDNVMLEAGPAARCKLIDWGIARAIASTARYTETGHAPGTPGYMAPEQARGNQTDWRSDVYALGVVAYELLCGRPPFEAPTSLDLLVRHLTETPPPPRTLRPELPARLDAAIVAMMRKQPDRRPRLGDLEVTLRGLARQLDEVEDEITLEYDVVIDDEPGEVASAGRACDEAACRSTPPLTARRCSRSARAARHGIAPSMAG